MNKDNKTTLGTTQARLIDRLGSDLTVANAARVSCDLANDTLAAFATVRSEPKRSIKRACVVPKVGTSDGKRRDSGFNLFIFYYLHVIS